MSRKQFLPPHIAALVREFEAAHANNDAPQIDKFLSRCEDHGNHGLLLQLLLKKDIEHALQNGQAIDADAFARLGPTAVDLAKSHLALYQQNQFQLSGYTIQQELGRGSMGTIYAGIRESDHHPVAIKTLQYADPSLLLRLKKEFRSLQGLPTHPNLVDLYDLYVSKGVAAFTMEAVEGRRLSQLLEQKLLPDQVFADLFRQIAIGVAHLHNHGLLHRDLKPDNVLITPDLRAVIVDLGLVAELRGGITEQTLDYHLKGSLPYMSPEQASGAELTPASDWYSFGVIIYQFLFGEHPHQGSSLIHFLEQKHQPFVAPENEFSDLNEKLLQLVCQLLAVSPADRPSGQAVVESLNRELLSTEGVETSVNTGQDFFAGRKKELAELFEFVKETELPALVEVAGQSGYGKTDFLAEFQKRYVFQCGQAVFATGKCYRQENVAYPGFDELVDHLAIQLNQWNELAVRAILPRRLHALIEMFPALGTVGPIADQDQKLRLSHSHEAKVQAISSFIELLARIADTGPLVLVIDDCQWANQEWLNLIRKILASEQSPQVLIVIAYRECEMESIRDQVGCENYKSLSIGPLNIDDCQALFSHSTFQIPAQPQDWYQKICEQTSGSPLHLREVATYLSTHETEPENFRYEALIQQRIQGLPELDVQALKTLGCSDFPIHRFFLEELLGDSILQRLEKLISDRLVVYRDQQRTFELHHALIGKAIRSLLSEDEKHKIHQRLAACFELDPKSRFEQQIEQLKLANRMADAAQRMCLAAEKSIEVLAYGEAISLFEEALLLRQEHSDLSEHEGVEKRLAEVYGLAGYAKKSAQLYRELLEKEDNTARRFEYAKNAAYNLMTSGRVDEGAEFLAIAAEHGGVSLRSSKIRCLLGILFNRIGYLVGKKGATKQDNRDYEVSVVLADGIFLVDPLMSAYFQSRAVRLSKKGGGQKHYFMSRCEEILNLSVENDIWRKIGARVLDQLKAEADASDDPRFWADYQKAYCNHHFFSQNFDKVLQANGDSLQYYLEFSPGDVWHITALWSIRFWTLLLCGEFKMMKEQLRTPLRRALEKGDLNTVRSLAEAHCTTHLVADDLAAARRELKGIREKLPETQYSVSHLNADCAESSIHLYAGNYRDVVSLLYESTKQFKSSETSQLQVGRMMRAHYEASALGHAIASQPADCDRLIARLKRIEKQLKREKTEYASGLLRVIMAFFAWRDETPDEAIQHVAAAVEHYETCGARAYSNALKWKISKSSMPVSESWARESADYAADQQIADFDRLANIFSLPFPDHGK